MGITRHSALVKTAGGCEVSKAVKSLSKTRTPIIAVDAPICFQKDISRAKRQWTRVKEYYWKDPDQFVLEKLQKEAVETLMMFVSAGLIPKFIFDGQAPPEKSVSYEKRKKEKARYEERYEKNQAQLERCREQGRRPPPEVVEEYRLVFNYRYRGPDDALDCYKQVFRAFGATVIDAPLEADPYCVYLEKNGVVDAIYSNDSDIHAHGGKYRFEKIVESVSERDDGSYGMEHFLVGTSLEVLLRKLEITFEQYQQICWLAGTDYNTNVPKYGIGQAYKDIKKLGNIEDVLKQKRFEKKDTSCLRLETVKRMFLVTDTEEYGEVPDLSVGFQHIEFEVWGENYLNELGIQKIAEHQAAIRALVEGSD